MGKLFPRLALSNLVRNRRFYLPYLLALMGTAAAFYIIVALASAQDLPVMTRYAYLSRFMGIGVFVVALFAAIFLTYTSGFLMKRRRRELGLYLVLGMGKPHLALMLGMEAVYTAVLGIGGGILLGLLLQKLVTLLLYQIMGFGGYFGFYVSRTGITATVLLFAAILVFDLVVDLVRMGRLSPMELMREGSAGEREPKTRWPLTVLGVLCLGGGYGIALFARNAGTAFTLYFPAVFLVIIGTYALFCSVSIAVLKALRRNKRFYYQTSHFIGVSGMLYRMRRNAVGLANICILSTMVLVMVSATLSLYLNSQQTLETQFPGDVTARIEYDPTADRPLDPAAADTQVRETILQAGLPAEGLFQYRYFDCYAQPLDDGSYLYWDHYESGSVDLHLITAADYAAFHGEAALTFAPLTVQVPLSFDEDQRTVERRAVTISAAALEEGIPPVGGAFASTLEPVWYVVEDEDDLMAVYRAQQAVATANDRPYDLMTWQGTYRAAADTETMLDLPQELEQAASDWTDSIGSWQRLDFETKEAFSSNYYALNGGFFFLGLFLGLLFIMAAVLIIYYKQISEGYEDRARYRTMQRVGLEPEMIRRSIRSQILVVFFAPLIVAAVHVAFDYGLMLQLLRMFGLWAPWLTLACTAGTFLVFAALYAMVFALTARTYAKIVA